MRYPLVVNGIKICTYICDFRIRWSAGSRLSSVREELVECKGMITREAAIKMKLFRALHPEIPLRIVK